jgi:uncharacterized protein YbbC (DUF1343 family)
LSDESVEGGPVRTGFTSFIGKYPVAYRHGMTLAELARMINGEGYLPGGKKCDLNVVACQQLMRNFYPWERQTVHPWVPTSPHVPKAETALYYVATGITGELSTVSIGVGYPLPFELAGAAGIGAVAFTREMRRRNLPGWEFREASWIPYYGAYKGESCGGTQLYWSGSESLASLNFHILDALRKLSPTRKWLPAGESARMFDLSCGTDRVSRAFNKGANAREMTQIFNDGVEAFKARRKPYLLYPT